MRIRVSAPHTHHPAIDRDVIDLDTALDKQLFDVAVGL